MESRNQDKQTTPAVSLYKQISQFLKLLKKLVDEDELDIFSKLESELKHALYHEDDTPKTEVTVREMEEKQRIEEALRKGNLEKIDAVTLTRLEELRLREQQNQLSDQVMEVQRDKQGNALAGIVVNNDIQLRTAIKTAELQAETEAAGCCARLFCCFFPQGAKDARKELGDLSQRQRAELRQREQITQAADSRIDQLRQQRKQADLELAHVAEKQRHIVSATTLHDKERKRLAQISYFIKYDQDNDQHFLEDETMLMLLRFYEHMMLFRKQLLISSEIEPKSEKSKLLAATQFDKNKKAIELIDKYLNVNSGMLFKSLKKFFCKDRDEMTTTFDEFHEKYRQLSRDASEEEQRDYLDDPYLLEKLSQYQEALFSNIKLRQSP
jgi:hypothetical protein